jgi:putative hydrolase of the HAD superfamily
MTTSTPEALLFDLGGVLIDVEPRRVLEAWSPHSRLDPDALAAAFEIDDVYRGHERGEISDDDFFRHVIAELELDADLETVRAGWIAALVAEIEETTALVSAVRSQVPCYAFTNTNAAHMDVWEQRFPRVVNAFDRIFASHRIGLRKPDAEAFAQVAESIGVAPGSIVFFDDVAENVRGATTAGLSSVLVTEPADVRDALAAIGLNTAGPALKA